MSVDEPLPVDDEDDDGVDEEPVPVEPVRSVSVSFLP